MVSTGPKSIELVGNFNERVQLGKMLPTFSVCFKDSSGQSAVVSEPFTLQVTANSICVENFSAVDETDVSYTVRNNLKLFVCVFISLLFWTLRRIRTDLACLKEYLLLCRNKIV